MLQLPFQLRPHSLIAASVICDLRHRHAAETQVPEIASIAVSARL
jgi:hypothetical protein